MGHAAEGIHREGAMDPPEKAAAKHGSRITGNGSVERFGHANQVTGLTDAAG